MPNKMLTRILRATIKLASFETKHLLLELANAGSSDNFNKRNIS